jgi:hypothetical protein
MTHHNHDIEDSLDLENRRIAKRFQLNVPLLCNGKPATSINISVTGIRYVSSQPLNSGSKAQLKLCFEGEGMELVGETVWSEKVGTGTIVGASFVEGTETQALSRYLDKLVC